MSTRSDTHAAPVGARTDAAREASSVPLAGTLSPGAAAARTWDVIVVGAGPAGALAACRLAQSGLSTLLLDRQRFPRGKVCGCCINPRALDALARAGLGDLPRRLGALPLRRLELAVNGRRAGVPLPGGVALSRDVLDAALVEAACERGAHFLPEALASSAGPPAVGGCRRVRIEHGAAHAELSARLVLVADGLGSRFLDASELGSTSVAAGSRVGAGTVLDAAPDALPAGSVAMACGEAGYVGLVRLQDDRLDVAAAFDARALADAGGARGAGALADRLIARAGLPELAGLRLEDATWRGTPPLTRHPGRRGARGALLLGDACGYVEPFTGEGIAWALCSALAVTPLAVAAVRTWDDGLIAAWEKQWRATIGSRQRACRAVAWLLRHPRLLSPCVAALALRPGLATPLLAGLAAPGRDAPRAGGAPA